MIEEARLKDSKVSTSEEKQDKIGQLNELSEVNLAERFLDVSQREIEFSAERA